MTNQDDLEQHFLVNLHELLVPLVDIGRLATRVIVVASAGGVVLMVGAPLNDLFQDGFVDLNTHTKLESPDLVAVLTSSGPSIWRTHVGNGDGLVRITQILQHVLDQQRTLSDIAIYRQTPR